jgi:hypothetical protein
MQSIGNWGAQQAKRRVRRVVVVNKNAAELRNNV